jgi:hypothetical protein
MILECNLSMKKRILATLFLFLAFHLLLASTDLASQQSLMTAKRQSDLFHHDTSSFELDIDFLVQLRVPTQGHLTLKWEADDRWWRKITTGDFQQTDIRNGDKLYTSRNAPFTPVQIEELVELPYFAAHLEELKVKKGKQRVEHGIEISCLQVQNARGEQHELCLDSASNEVLSDEWKAAPDVLRRQQYSDYFDFDGDRYPHKLEVFVNGKRKSWQMWVV